MRSDSGGRDVGQKLDINKCEHDSNVEDRRTVSQLCTLGELCVVSVGARLIVRDPEVRAMACFLIVSDHERSFPTEIKRSTSVFFCEGSDKQHNAISQTISFR